MKPSPLVALAFFLAGSLHAATTDKTAPKWYADRSLEQARAMSMPICVIFEIPVKTPPKDPVETAWSVSYANPEFRAILKKEFHCIKVNVTDMGKAAKLWPREMVDAGKQSKYQIYLMSSDFRMQPTFTAETAGLAAIKTAAENIVKYDKQRKEEFRIKAERERQQAMERDKNKAEKEDPANDLKVPGLDNASQKKDPKAGNTEAKKPPVPADE